MDYRSSHTSIEKGKTYDKSFISSDYRQFILKWENDVLQSIITEIVNSKENYLDFACGTGRITKLMESSFTNSFGIDVSESMLKETANKLSCTKLIQQDITASNPFNKNQMDLITSFRFFLNAEPKLRSEVLEQLYYILNPNGFFVFNIHNNKTLISGIIDKLAVFKKKLYKQNFTPQKSISLKDVKVLLKEHNFKIVNIYHKAVIPLKSEASKFKISKFSFIENFFSNFSPSKHISKNIIFVCKKI